LNDPRSVPIPAALDTPAFRDAWEKFVAYRAGRGKKNAMTALAAQLALKKVAPLGPAGAIERIERAIMNSWLGLEYPGDKQKQAGGGHGSAAGGGGPGGGVGRLGRNEPRPGEYDAFRAGPGPAAPPEAPPGPPPASAA
jgi:hypothetical protein